MSGDRSYGDLDIISYGTKHMQKGRNRRSSSIRANNARKNSIGNNGGMVRDGEIRNGRYPQSRNIKTIHTKSNGIRGGVRSNGGAVSVIGDVRTGKGAGRSGSSGNAKYGKTRGRYESEGKRPYDVREVRMASKRKKRRQRAFIARFISALSICIAAGAIGICMYALLFEKEQIETGKITDLSSLTKTPFTKENNWTIEDIMAALEREGINCTQDFLSVNEYSRPAEKLRKVNNIFVHYTANPATSAAQNRSYFENLSETHETSASAHFIIGYEGELVQCIPLEEIAYAVAGRNEDSISIECCYLEENGEFTKETYETLVHFAARLLEKYGLEASDLRRHYDEGGKSCPKYYVENEEEWWAFVRDVKTYKNTLQDE